MPETRDFIRTIERRTATARTRSAVSSYPVVKNEAIDNLKAEGGENFFNYVKSIGLSEDPGLIVLSSRHHYYYGAEELNEVRTVIHLKELNRIKEIDTLLYSHLHFLPQGCNFVGCFVNNNRKERFVSGNGSAPGERIKNPLEEELDIASRFSFINKLYSIMDSKTNAYMSEKSVGLMLGIHGFKVMNMKETDGLTFFHSQKTGEI